MIQKNLTNGQTVELNNTVFHNKDKKSNVISLALLGKSGKYLAGACIKIDDLKKLIAEQEKLNHEVVC
jgi:hypothetical protein